MKTIILTFILLTGLLLVGSGCGKETNFMIVENHDITACGVNDPLKNVQWLTEFCKEHTPTDFTGNTLTISIYKSKTSVENHYVISFVNSEVVDYSRKEVYDCSGLRLFLKGIAGPAPTGWDEFFQENEFVATIWELKAKN